MPVPMPRHMHLCYICYNRGGLLTSPATLSCCGSTGLGLGLILFTRSVHKPHHCTKLYTYLGISLLPSHMVLTLRSLY